MGTSGCYMVRCETPPEWHYECQYAYLPFPFRSFCMMEEVQQLWELTPLSCKASSRAFPSASKKERVTPEDDRHVSELLVGSWTSRPEFTMFFHNKDPGLLQAMGAAQWMFALCWPLKVPQRSYLVPAYCENLCVCVSPYVFANVFLQWALGASSFWVRDWHSASIAA